LELALEADMAERIQLPYGTPAVRAQPPGGKGPGIVIGHAWWGLKPFFVELADRLAADGFVVIAPDLFGTGEVVSTVEAAEARLEKLDWHAVGRRMLAAHDALASDPARSGAGIGAVGFSMGASRAGSTARQRDDVRAVVLAYGTDGSPDVAKPDAAWLGHFAPGDSWEPDEGVDALEERLRAAGRRVTFHRYPGTQHWFLEDDRPEYDPAAAELFWQRTTAFLHEVLDAG
jgi:carboxymethylenebutenolidase